MIYPRGKNGTLYTRIRIPERYKAFYPRPFFDKSLKTDSREIAAEKEREVRELLMLSLEAQRAGAAGEAAEWFEKLVELCDRRGFRYAAAQDIAARPLRNILERVEAVDTDDAADVAALLGAAGDIGVPMSSLFERYRNIKEPELINKSDDQLRKWAITPKRAIATFIEVVGDIDFLSMSRDDGAKLRAHLAQRVTAGELQAYSANRLIYTLNTVCKTVAQIQFAQDHSALDKLTFKEKRAARRNKQIGFSEAWIRDKLLAPGALDGMNEEATDILIAMINTGLRPSEVAALNEATINLDSNIPHVVVQADGRELKTVSSERVMPLHGVSLEAIRRHPAGFPRYRDKAANWSAAVGKKLKAAQLLETEEHRAYSLRHGFADRLTDVGCPDRVQDQLMGHREEGTAYGTGASLEALSGWVSKVAI